MRKNGFFRLTSRDCWPIFNMSYYKEETTRTLLTLLIAAKKMVQLK